MKIKGIAHVHSCFSDSALTLARVKKEAKKRGINFALLSDHLGRVEDFKRLADECASLSDDDFLMVPGIEINTREGYHFLIYNLFNPPLLEDRKVPAQALCEMFSGRESLLVLAHASMYRRPPAEDILKHLDGIEVWNTKYDTKHAPSVKSLKLAHEHNLIPFAAIDAHGPFCLKKLWLELEVERFTREDIIAVLKKGDFRVATKSLSLNLKEELSPAQKISFRRRNRFYGSLHYPLSLLVRSGFVCPKFLIRIYQELFRGL